MQSVISYLQSVISYLQSVISYLRLVELFCFPVPCFRTLAVSLVSGFFSFSFFLSFLQLDYMFIYIRAKHNTREVNSVHTLTLSCRLFFIRSKWQNLRS